MNFDRRDLSNDTLINFYKTLLWPRLVEEKMLMLLRQGRIGKWFSGIGQEAIAVGATLALEADEYILPMHRNLGVFTARNMPLARLVAQWQGKPSGYTQGRDRSFHFGTHEHHIVGMISHLGPQLAVADGIALANLIGKKTKVTLAFTGEGATSEGDFHEALNVAAVWNLPIIFLIENNGYALSTPTHEQFKCARIVDKAIGYGMEGHQIDGNNFLEVYHTVKDLAASIRQHPRPVLLECITFRMRGHEEASGIKYVPPQLLEEWKAKDPVRNFEQFLINNFILRPEWPNIIKRELMPMIEADIEQAMQEADLAPDMQKEIQEMYAPTPASPAPSFPTSATQNKRFIDAISEALRLSMQQHSNLILMGQDIAEYGGAFKVTEGFAAEFGTARVRNTPLCESAIVGTALGLAIKGYKSVVEMQFADFVTCGFNQIVNNLAKTHYRWGQAADTVIRMPTGAGTGAGPFHSQSNEAWFTKVPGLKVVYPAFSDDAKGLLIAAVNDPNPVIYFEHKYLYRNLNGEVPEGTYEIEIGKAKVVQEGTQVSVITYGLGVHWALEWAQQHPNYSVEIVDLRSLQPWDKAAVETSVRKTSKVLILHEDTLTSGFGGEIAAHITEHCFEHLDGPVTRCASLDTAIPMNNGLEDQFLAKTRLNEALIKLIKY